MARLQSVEAKRQREKRMVQEMVAVLPQKARRTKTPVPRMRRVGRICGAAQRPMSVHGDKNLLLQLQCTLLPS